MITRSMIAAMVGPTPDIRTEFDARPEKLRRSFTGRASTTDSEFGGIDGVAIQLGTLDSYRSVFSPKAFDKKCLAEFVRDGFISDNHKWDEDVATINKAVVVGRELQVEAEFLEDDESQQLRIKCKNRIDRNKSIGFSVGVYPDWSAVQEFESGKKLWEYAEKVLNEDMSLYDPSIKKFDGWCWLIGKVRRLVEVAITLIPSIPGSMVTDTRSDLSNDPRGVSFVVALTEALGALERVTARSLDIEAIRADKGGTIGKENMARIVAIRDELSGLIDRAQTPEEGTSTDDALAERFARLEATRRLAALGTTRQEHQTR